MGEEVSQAEGFWAEEFDLSALTYPQFLAFFFDRPVVGEKEEYGLFRSGIDHFVASSPAVVADHLRRMCCDLSDLTKLYSHEQIDQGLWAVFGAGIGCERYLFDPTVDPKARVACIESMCLPFRDVVAKSELGKTESFYWMWWDMILHTFGYQTTEECEHASPDARRMLDAIHETLLRILALDHPACQWSSLHGLGHSPHPKASGVVHEYLQVHGNELTEEDAAWVERCALGNIA